MQCHGFTYDLFFSITNVAEQRNFRFVADATWSNNSVSVEQKLDHDFSNCRDLTPKIMNRRGSVEGTDLVLPPSGFFIAKH